jgi:putative methyltransferase (TIGR04325 family)
MSNISKDEIAEYPSWSEASLNSNGYTDPNLAQVLGRQYAEKLNSSSTNEVDVRFSSRKLHLIAGYLIACSHTASPKIADVGGGNGYMFDWIRTIDSNVSINFTVFESEQIATIYQDLKKDAELNFLPISQFATFSNVDLVILSCTLQYLADWDEILMSALKKSKYVLILRTPIIETADHKIYVQTPPDGAYAVARASWPIRFFSRAKLLNLIQQNSRIIFSAQDFEEGFFFDESVNPLESFLLCSKWTTYNSTA